MHENILVQKICMSYGEKTVLQDFSAEFPKGKCSVVMGPSGCGKTTLLRILPGLEKPLSGMVTGVPDAVSMVFQEDRLLELLSPRENIKAVLGRKVQSAVIERTLKKLALDGNEGKTAGQLSGGMKRRVSIARAVLAPHEILIMDEPFQGLDRDTKLKVIQTLLECEKNRTIIFATHDPEDASLMNASYILRM